MCIHNEQALIKKCACGYDPKKNRQKEDCTETKALLNHLTFPSLKTSEANRSDKRHMAALLEIISDVFVSWCNQCFARNCYGEVFKLQFFDCTKCCSNPNPAYFADLKQGNTVAILNADNIEESMVVNVMNYDECMVFKSDLKCLLNEGDKLLRDLELTERNEMRECFGCGLKFDNLKICARCKLAQYCSTDCQKKCWSNGHKSLCGQSQEIQSLSLLPRLDYNGSGLRFRESKPNGEEGILAVISSPRPYPLLPKYKPIKTTYVQPTEAASETKISNILTSSSNRSPQKLARGFGEKKKMSDKNSHTPSKKFKETEESKENMECN